MNRVAAAAAALVCSLGLAAGAAAPAGAAVRARPEIPGVAASSRQVSEQVQQYTQMSSDAVNEAWLRGYNALPQAVRDAVPREIRPAELATRPLLPAAPHYEPGAEPAPAPDTCANCVAITFDDGPVGDTSRLLDTLDRMHAHATFFVVGTNADDNPATLRRMQAAGHAIGNHTFNHPRLPMLAEGGIGAQLDDASAAITRATGTAPRWVRPPYGEYDGRVAAAAGARGMSVVIWDVDTEDWRYRDAQRTCRVAVDQARAGSVVLMHDIHPATVDAVPCIVDGLRAKGLRPASLDEMITQPVAGHVYTRRP